MPRIARGSYGVAQYKVVRQHILYPDKTAVLDSDGMLIVELALRARIDYLQYITEAYWESGHLDAARDRWCFWNETKQVLQRLDTLHNL